MSTFNILSKRFLLIFFSLYSFAVNAQNDSLKIDSLKKVLLTQKEDTNKVNTLNNLSNTLLASNDYKNSVIYAKAALSLSEKLDFKEGKAQSCYNIGYIYTYTAESNNHNGLEYFLTALSIWSEVNNKDRLANTHYDMANIYGAQGNYTEAIKHLYAGLALFEQLNKRKNVANCIYYIGLCYSSQGDHTEALKNAYKALSIHQQLKDEDWVASCYNLIGEENLSQGNYSEALKNQLLALKLYEKLGTKAYDAGIPSCYTSIGGIYEKEGDSFYPKNNKIVATIKYKDALKNYFTALKMWTRLDKRAGIAAVNAAIGTLYIKLNKFGEAQDYLTKSLQLSKIINSKEVTKESYKSLFQLDSAQRNFKQAFEHHKMYILYRDSLLNQETSKKLLQSKMQYDFDKKEAIAKTAQDKKDAEAKRIKTQQYFAIAALGILVLAVVIIAVMQFRNNKHKQKANIVLENTLTNLKSTQAQLIQSEKMASLGELTAGIAHEIQNPLNFVNNFSEVNNDLISELVEEVDKENYDEVKAIANDIKENEQKINHHGKRADAIVKNMLQHSRTSSGKKELTDINALADEYLRLSHHGFRAKDKSFNADFKTEFDESLSADEAGIGKINIVPQDIGRVLLNLYNNAFYAMNEKAKLTANGLSAEQVGYKPTAKVTTRRLNDKIEIRVEDNGNGIPQKVLDKIFQPFFTTKPTGQGTGLGLSLSYDIIKAHNGELTVETKEGEGTTFIIQLLLI